MASEPFVQLTIPRLDGHYDHWSILMENILMSKEYWIVNVSGVAEPVGGVAMTEVESWISSIEVEGYLQAKKKMGTTSSTLRGVRCFAHEVGRINWWFLPKDQTMAIVNQMQIHEDKEDVLVIEKILQSLMTINYVVCSIEESMNENLSRKIKNNKKL